MESFFPFTVTWVLGIELREQAHTENGFFFSFFFFPLSNLLSPFMKHLRNTSVLGIIF